MRTLATCAALHAGLDVAGDHLGQDAVTAVRGKDGHRR